MGSAIASTPIDVVRVSKYLIMRYRQLNVSVV